MAALNIVVVGASGHMGRMLVAAVLDDPDAVVSGATEAPGSPALGRDAGELAGREAIGVSVTDDPVPLFAAADAVLDFTSPAATERHSELAAQARCVHVAGTSGLSDDQEAALSRAARHTAIIHAPNTSVGVVLLQALTRQVAGILGADWDIEICEMHHRRKVDAPSGTALALGREAAAGRGVELGEVRQSVRDGITGPRRAGDIGFATMRGGTVTGEHSVVFAGEHERLTLGHVATSREIYARGALRAAHWGSGKPPGLYTMRDVLGL